MEDGTYTVVYLATAAEDDGTQPSSSNQEMLIQATAEAFSTLG